MITIKQKNDILAKIRKEDTDGSGYLLSSLGTYLKEELGIEWRQHASSFSQNMSSWLVEQVSRYLVINQDRVSFPPVDSSHLERVRRLIMENLSDNGTMEISMLQQKMTEEGIGPWRLLLKPNENFDKMYLWVQAHFSRDFTLERDGPTWFLRQRVVTVPENAVAYPIEVDPDDSISMDEVKRMNDFAFMGGINKIRQAFRRLTGYSGNQDAVWRAIIAREIAKARNYPEGNYWEAPGPDGRFRVAIRLQDLTTPSGFQLFLVFTENEISGLLENGKQAQKWRLMECCYSGQPGCGVWLFDALHIPVGEDLEAKQQRERIQQLLKEMADLQQELPELLKTAAEHVQAGRPLPGTLAGAVRRYNEGWKNLTVHALPSGVLPEETTLDEIRRAVKTNQASRRQIEDAYVRLRQMIEAIRGELVNMHLIAADETAVPVKDQNALAEWFSRLSQNEESQPDPALPLELLGIYGGLCRLGERDVLSNDESEQLIEIAEHLGVNLRSLNAYFVGQHPFSALCDEVDEIANAIRRSSQWTDAPVQTDKAAVFDTAASPLGRQEILQNIFTQERISDIELAKAFPSPNRFERAVVDNDRAAIDQLAEDDAAMRECGYSADETANIRKLLADHPKLPRGSAPLFVGIRIYQLQGNLNGQAERYWLAAGRSNEEALLQLLALYRRENRQADFLLVYSHCPEDMSIPVEDRHYMLKCCNDRGDYAATVRAARSYPELVYQSVDGEDNRELILYAAGQCEDQELAEHCQDVQHHFYANFDTDPLEDAIIDNDLQTVEYLLSSPDEVAHYTPSELEHLRDALRSGDLPKETTAFETGVRIWRMLGNRHGLAEYFLWRGIQHTGLTLQMETVIFPLLADVQQPRWRELIVLYEAYSSKLEHQEACRRVYLQALCAEAPDRAADFAREHLVDALNPELYQTIREICAQYAPRLAGLLEKLSEGAASSEFCSCVIRSSAALRDVVLQSDSIAALGFSAADVSRITAVFRGGDYPRQQDSAHMAKRLYLFMEGRDGLAEETALFAVEDARERGQTPDPDALLVLADLCRLNGKWQELLTLFEQNDGLAEKRMGSYALALVRTHQYRRYHEDAGRLAPMLEDPIRSSFGQIAALRAGIETDNLPPEELHLLPEYIRSEPEEIILLSAWLWEQGSTSVWASLIPQWAHEALAAYSQDQLSALLSAQGQLNGAQLSLFRDQWLSSPEGTEAAIYAWRYLNAASVEEAAQSFYETACAGGELAPGGWRRLELLFPEQGETIRFRRIAAGIREQLQKEVSDEKKAAGVRSLLTEESLDAVHLRELVELLDGAGLIPLLSGTLYALCSESAGPEPMQTLSDAFLRLSPLPEAIHKDAVSLWDTLVQRDRLEPEDRTKIRAQAEADMALRHQPETALLLLRLYRKDNAVLPERMARAYFTGTVSLPPAVGNAVGSLIGEEEKRERLLDLFCTVEPTVWGLTDFFQLAAAFFPPWKEDYDIAVRYGRSDGEEPCTPEEADAILRVLCLQQERSAWMAAKNLPLEDFPALRLELLLFCARRWGTDTLWNRCVNYALNSDQEDALPRLLTARLRFTKTAQASVGAQKQIRSVLRLEEFESDLPSFPFLTDPDRREELEALLDAFCNVMEGGSRHEYLCTLAMLAVRSGCEDRLLDHAETMELYFSETGQSAIALLASLTLLAEHIAPAKRLLRMMRTHPISPAYHSLFLEMEAMEAGELAGYVRQEVPRTLLKLLLPNGTRPTYDLILQELVWPVVTKAGPEDPAVYVKIIQKMMELTPLDQPVPLALFLVCKREFPNRLEALYQAEYQMCQRLAQNSGHFHSRSVNAQMCDLILLGCLLNRLNMGSSAQGGAPSQELYGRLLDRIWASRPREDLEDPRTRAMLAMYGKKKKDYRPVPIRSSQIFDFYTQSLDNLQEDDLQDVQDVIIARITGCWEDIIFRLFEEKKNISAYTSWLMDPNVEEVSACHVTGLLRGILRVALRVPFPQKEEFKSWLEAQANQPAFHIHPNGIADPRPLLVYPGLPFAQARYLLDRRGEALQHNSDLLNLPLEETAINFRLIGSALEAFPRVGKSADGAWAGRDYLRLQYRVLFTILIQGDIQAASFAANSYFKKSQQMDLELACAYYNAIVESLNIVTVRDQKVPLIYCSLLLQAEFRARSYLCCCAVSHSPHPNRNDALLLNCLIQALACGLTEELPNFLACIAEKNREFLLCLYPLLAQQQILDREEEQLSFAASFADPKREQLTLQLFFQMGHVARRPNAQLQTRIKELLEAGNKSVIVNFKRIDGRDLPSAEQLRQQTEALIGSRLMNAAEPEEPAGTQEPDALEEESAFEEPAFVSAVARSISETRDEAPAQDQAGLHAQTADKLQSASAVFAAADRTEILRQQRFSRYQAYRALPENDVHKLSACLSLGVTEWHWRRERMRRDHTGRTGMDAVLFELALLGRQCGAQAPGYKEYARIPASALYDLLLNGYSNMEDLVHVYKNNRVSFHALLEPISASDADGRVCDSLQRLYSNLDQIAEAFQLPSEDLCIRRLEAILPLFDTSGDSYQRMREWTDVFGRLKGLLSALVAGLRNRPQLNILILNTGSDAHGALFGKVTNEGTLGAEDLVLSVVFAEGIPGGEYVLSQIRRGGAAAFCIRFNAPPECSALHWTLTLRYSCNGQTINDPPVSGVLNLSPKERPVLPPAPYPTNAVENFTITPDGDVYSPLMVGREREKQQLRALVSGPFSNYQDALVYGFRRVGKTTLLNYLFHYIEYNGREEQVIPIMVTCQDIRSTLCIQATFIDSVLVALPYTLGGSSAPENDEELQDLLHSEEWDRFKASWTLDAGTGTDRTASDIKRFYVELSAFLKGRRFVLILDEMDYLFSLVEETQGVDNGLLHVLDSLVDDMLLHRLIHFIFCGSNKMIRYSMDGGVLSQIFQRINTIKVGALPFDDIRTRLLLPCSGKYTMQYTEEALRDIYAFTGGAIWHTLIMGTAILDYKLMAENRSRIYPSDVYDPQVIQSVIADNNCRQFTEGCREVELKILEIMQAHCTHLESIVDLAQIRAELPEETSPAAITAALSLLCALGLIKPGHYAGGDCYQFASELYWAFFRRSGKNASGQDNLLFRPVSQTEYKTSEELAKEVQKSIEDDEDFL